MSKKDASLDALFSEGSAPLKEEMEVSALKREDNKASASTKKLGRPKKEGGKRQQIPLYLPEPVYFEILDWVNLQKRSSRKYCMNDVFLEAIDVWLKKNGRPSIKNLIDSNL